MLGCAVRLKFFLAMPSQYIPILIYALLAAAFPAVTLAIFKYIRPDSKATGAKLEPYECGVPPEGNARGRYSVRFYIVAILVCDFRRGDDFSFSLGDPVRAIGSVWIGHDDRVPGDSAGWLCVVVSEGRVGLGLGAVLDG